MSANDARKQSLYFPEEMLSEIQTQAQRLDRLGQERLGAVAQARLGAHPLGVFLQLGGVISLGEDVLQEDGMWHTDGPQILHGRAQKTGLDVLVALELDLPDLNLRSFLHHKRDAHSRRGNLPDFRANCGKLPTVLGKQSFD